MKAISKILIILCLLSSPAEAQDKVDLLFRSEKILASGDTTRAIDAFSETLRLFPQSFAASLRLAEISFSSKKYTEAVQYCNIALDITDNLITSRENSLKVLGLPPDSTHRERRFNTDQAYIHHLKGIIRIAQQRPVDAEHEFRRSLALSRDNKVLLDLSLLLANQGRFEAAKKLLKKQLMSNNKNSAIRMNLAALYKETNNIDSAVLIYREVVRYDSTNQWPYLHLGNIYAEQVELKKAITSYSHFIKIDTTSAEVYYRRAVMYTDLADWKNALHDWNKTLKIQKSADGYRNRGLTHFQLAHYENAIADFDSALKLEPDQAYTQINRGYCYYLNNQPKLALNDIENGLAIVPKYYLGHYFKALALFQLRKKKRSCSALTKAVELGLKDEDIDQKLLKKCY